MGYVGTHAARTPDRPAVITVGSTDAGDIGAVTVLSYRELDEGSNRFAHHCRALGIGVGGHVAILAENHPRYLEACWGADRSGLYTTAVNHHLTTDEAGYIVADCEATILVTSPALAALAVEIAPRCSHLRQILVLGPSVLVDGDLVRDYGAELAGYPTTPVADEQVGFPMLYSSGTTGKPKGILKPLLGIAGADEHPYETMFKALYGMTPESVYLSPAPLYHASPLGFCLAVHRLGGTVVVMDRFDAAGALALIEEYRITHAQFVPTMFVRMLKLPATEREGFDLSSLEVAVHAAAPCPRSVKEQMLEWWGPIIYEYYGGTEVNGLTFVAPRDWVAHPGTVGKSILGDILILDDDLQPVPTGEIGGVYFANGGVFEYHNDAEKTEAASNGHGATTIGDVGYLDDEGYLYLTDRKSFMVISGGVNIYPQEVEDVLIAHPRVADVAVFGVPDEDLGEVVKAVVQPLDGVLDDPDLEAELLVWCRNRLSRFKCPRSIDFEAELPRTDAGKLYKRRLRERYWADNSTGIPS